MCAVDAIVQRAGNQNTLLDGRDCPQLLFLHRLVYPKDFAALVAALYIFSAVISDVLFTIHRLRMALLQSDWIATIVAKRRSSVY